MTRMTKVITTVTTAFFALGLFSCSNFQDSGAIAVPFVAPTFDANAAYLTLSLDDASVSKTLLPDVQSAVFESLVLKGTKQGGAQRTLGSWASAAAMQSASIPLELGTWTFNLSAASGGSSFSGTLQKEIVSGQNSLLFSLALDDIGGGPGSFSLALSFDGAANAQNVSRVVASLENMDKTIVSGYEPKNLAISNNAVTFSGSQITAGTYRAKIKFYASVNGVDTEIASWSELVQIASGFDSSASRTIESFDELYTITYELNGGSFAPGTVAPETFTRRSAAIALPQSVARDYYTFSGWHTDSTCSAESKITAIGNGDENVTLYAKWTAKKYTITYNFVHKLIKSTYTVEDDVSLVEPSEEDISFIEWWFEDAECAMQTITGWKAGERHSDINLYAKYNVSATGDSNNIVAKIKNMTKSGTVKATGIFSADVIRKINAALKELHSSKPDILVTLDLSEVQGLSGLEEASSLNNYCSFYECVNLKQVILPSGEFSIGANAFKGCVGLKNVTVPDSVKSIGEGAFSGCSSLEKITLPFVGKYAADEVKSCEEWLFGYIFGKNSYDGGTATKQKYEVYSPTGGHVWYEEEPTFYIPASLKKVVLTSNAIIPRYAFYNCKEITEVVIPETTTKIGHYAFNYCLSLDNINIPDSVEVIEGEAFYHTNAVNIKIGKIAEKGVSLSGLFSGNVTKNVSFSEGVTKIGDGLFKNSEAPLNIQFSSNITSIGNHAFENASGLTDFVIPNSIESIGEYIFSGCSNLKSVTFPSGITEIPSHAFSGCSSLETMTIPDSITSLGDYIFSDCANLKSVTFPNGITEIPNGTFSGCANFKTIIIPSGLTSIGNYAFSGCTALKYDSLPSFDNVTKIGWCAFENCASLWRINIPYGLKYIPSGFCKGCSKLSYIYWSKANDIESIGESAFENCTALEFSLTFPVSLKKIGKKAFQGCTSLTTLKFDTEINAIEACAFNGCSSLKSAEFKDTTSLWYWKDEEGKPAPYIGDVGSPMETDVKENAKALLRITDYGLYRK